MFERTTVGNNVSLFQIKKMFLPNIITIETWYKDVVGRHVSHPRYKLTAVYRNGEKVMAHNGKSTYPFC